MDRINSANAVVVDGKRVFTDAAGTKFTGVWCTGIQEEIATFIESQGLDLSATDNTQLAQAVAIFVADQLDGLETALLQKIIQDAWYSFFPGATSNVDGTTGIRKYPRHPMSITSALVWCTGAAPSATRVIIYCNGVEAGSATIPKGSESAAQAFSPAISVSSSDYLTVGLESTGAVGVGVRLDFNKSFFGGNLMYLEYKTKSTGWSKTQMLADIIGAVTGGITTVDGFSDSCDKTLTNFVSQSVAPGWTLDDNQITASSYAVISGVDKDGVTKCVKITAAASGSASLMVSCSGWNATTHAYSNSEYSGAVSGWDLSAATTAQLVLRVWATKRYIIILPYISAFGSPFGILEMPRPVNSAYWLASNGKSCCGVGNATPGAYLYLPSGVLYTGPSIYGWANTSYFLLGSQFGPTLSLYPHRNSSSGYNYEICTPQAVLYTGAYTSGGEYLDGLMVMPSSIGVATMDTTTYSSKEYTILNGNSTGSLLVPNE